MKSHITTREKGIATFSCIIVAVLISMLAVPLQAGAAQAGQKSFDSPESAVKALAGAVKADDRKELRAIFGPREKRILSSGDPVEDKAAMGRFLQAYEAKNAVNREGDDRAVLQIGEEEWPFPVPIVRKNGKWFFNTKKGEEELINRRVGRNELDTIQTCLAYVDAQREYATRDRETAGLLEYAQKFISTPGRKDGLYWEAKPGEEQSPLGDFFAKATAEGYRKKDSTPIPYHGYYFKILKGQGKNAAGGAYDYMVNGKMVAGFAMVAYPAQYGVSGVMTFIVSHDGVVYQKNLGKKSAQIARAMELFDPDATWRKAADSR